MKSYFDENNAWEEAYEIQITLKVEFSLHPWMLDLRLCDETDQSPFAEFWFGSWLIETIFSIFWSRLIKMMTLAFYYCGWLKR